MAIISHGLAQIALPRRTKAEALTYLRQSWADFTEDNEQALGNLAAQLKRYAQGERVEFDVPLDLDHLTSFRQLVLRTAAHIPCRAPFDFTFP